jgi:transposase
VAGGKRTAADLGGWIVFEDESGQGLRPPKGRTWGRRGQTPVVTVTGGSNKRVSLAALIAIKPGQHPRLIYRVHKSRRRGKDQRKGFTEADYARLLDAAHQQLGGPLVVIWDNLNSHVSQAMTELITARDWLTVYQLPPYAHELNPVEPVWSHLKRSLANLAKHNLAELTLEIFSRANRRDSASPPRRRSVRPDHRASARHRSRAVGSGGLGPGGHLLRPAAHRDGGPGPRSTPARTDPARPAVKDLVVARSSAISQARIRHNHPIYTVDQGLSVIHGSEPSHDSCTFAPCEPDPGARNGADLEG